MTDEISNAIRSFYLKMNILPTAIIVTPRIYVEWLRNSQGGYDSVDISFVNGRAIRKYKGLTVFVSDNVARFELVAQAVNGGENV